MPWGCSVQFKSGLPIQVPTTEDARKAQTYRGGDREMMGQRRASNCRLLLGADDNKCVRQLLSVWHPRKTDSRASTQGNELSKL